MNGGLNKEQVVLLLSEELQFFGELCNSDPRTVGYCTIPQQEAWSSLELEMNWKYIEFPMIFRH